MAVKNKKTSKKKALKITRKKVKRTTKKNPARRKTVIRKALPRKAKIAKKSNGEIVGTITHYFPKVRAAVIKLKTSLVTGDTIKIKGHTTDLAQIVSSMQVDHVPVNQAKKGQEIGLLVSSRVRQNDVVYREKKGQ